MALVVAGCTGGFQPESSPTRAALAEGGATPNPNPTPGPSPTPTPSPSPSPSPAPIPSPTPSPSPQPSPSPTPTPTPSPSPKTTCISDEITLVLTLQNGADAVLCPSTTISLHGSLTFTANGQQIYTQGTPTDSTRAILIIDPSATALNSVIDTETVQAGATQTVLDSIVIKNVIIDGNAQNMGQISNSICTFGDFCHGLVNLSGVTHPIVTQSWIRYSRTWTHLVLTHNYLTPDNNYHIGVCSGAQITNNEIGPTINTVEGVPAITHSDGISVNCGASTISQNQITDVTDGGIVVFAQQNTQVTNNTISAVKNHMNLAIGATDYPQGLGDYTGSVFSGNTINSMGGQGGFIYVGIVAGDRVVYGTTYQPNYDKNAVITNNTFNGSAIGMGIAVSGADNYTITGNQLNSTNMVVDPAYVMNSTLQPNYTSVAAGALDAVYGRGYYVERLYENFLGVGNGDSAGFTFWLTSLYPCTTSSGISVTQSFVNSASVVSYLNGLTPTQVTNALYLAILDAPSTPSGVAFWEPVIAQASSPAAGVESVVSDFFNSSQFQNEAPNSCVYANGN